MAQITVERVADDTFEVTVSEGGAATTHTVTASRDTVDDLGGGTDAADLVDASFRFLLDREPKGSILPSFDLTVIGRYFPEYPDAIGDYLG
jgi:hypothetical protein